MHKRQIDVAIEITIDADPKRCQAEAVIEGQIHGGATTVHWSERHGRFLLGPAWADFYFFDTWDQAFTEFLLDLTERLTTGAQDSFDRGAVIERNGV